MCLCIKGCVVRVIIGLLLDKLAAGKERRRSVDLRGAKGRRRAKVAVGSVHHARGKTDKQIT